MILGSDLNDGQKLRYDRRKEKQYFTTQMIFTTTDCLEIISDVTELL